jgi:hypothetical protein
VSQYRLKAEAAYCRFSGVAGHEGFSPKVLILKVIDGVAEHEGYSSQDLLLWVVDRQVGNEGCGLECKAESKPHATATLFRCIPSGVVKSVSINIYFIGVQPPS